MWLRLDPDWNLLRRQLYTGWPGIHTYDEINDRLFVNPGRNENILDAKSKMWRNLPEYWQWMGQIDYMWQFQDGFFFWLVAACFFFGSLLLGSSPGRSALQSAE